MITGQSQVETVHIYTIFLPYHRHVGKNGWNYLSDEEKERSSRIIAEPARKLFIQAHCLLRIILSAYLECRPDEIQFHTTLNGKPLLDDHFNLYFNISYREDYLLMAISGNPFTGCDIEKTGKLQDKESFLNLYYSGNEIQYIFSLKTESDRLKAIYRLWTMKEAFIKSMGTGISEKISNYNFLPFLESEVHKLPYDQNSRWCIKTWEVNSHYMAALAVKSDKIDLKYFNSIQGDMDNI